MRLVTIVGFLLCASAMLALMIASRIDPRVIAPFGTLLDRAMTSRAARVILVLFWWWLGWHFLVTAPLPA